MNGAYQPAPTNTIISREQLAKYANGPALVDGFRSIFGPTVPIDYQYVKQNGWTSTPTVATFLFGEHDVILQRIFTRALQPSALLGFCLPMKATDKLEKWVTERGASEEGEMQAAPEYTIARTIQTTGGKYKRRLERYHHAADFGSESLLTPQGLLDQHLKIVELGNKTIRLLHSKVIEELMSMPTLFEVLLRRIPNPSPLNEADLLLKRRRELFAGIQKPNVGLSNIMTTVDMATQGLDNPMNALIGARSILQTEGATREKVLEYLVSHGLSKIANIKEEKRMRAITVNMYNQLALIDYQAPTNSQTGNVNVDGMSREVLEGIFFPMTYEATRPVFAGSRDVRTNDMADGGYYHHRFRDVLKNAGIWASRDGKSNKVFAKHMLFGVNFGKKGRVADAYFQDLRRWDELKERAGKVGVNAETPFTYETLIEKNLAEALPITLIAKKELRLLTRSMIAMVAGEKTGNTYIAYPVASYGKDPQLRKEEIKVSFHAAAIVSNPNNVVVIPDVQIVTTLSGQYNTFHASPKHVTISELLHSTSGRCYSAFCADPDARIWKEFTLISSRIPHESLVALGISENVTSDAWKEMEKYYQGIMPHLKTMEVPELDGRTAFGPRSVPPMTYSVQTHWKRTSATEWGDVTYNSGSLGRIDGPGVNIILNGGLSYRT